jgi:hypothetical protein
MLAPNLGCATRLGNSALYSPLSPSKAHSSRAQMSTTLSPRTSDPEK